MPRLRRTTARPVRATAYPETRTDAGQYQLTPEAVKKVYYGKPPVEDTWNRTRYGRALNLDRIESALRGAQYGAMRDLCDLARETVATDPHLAAILQKRINSVASLPFNIVPAEGPGTDPAKAEANAELVRVQIGRIPHFRQALKQLAWGLFDGRAALEIQWLLRPTDQAQKTGGPYEEPKQDWVAANLIFIHPRRLQFGPARELRISDQVSTTGFQPVGVALQEFPFKFLEFKPQLFGDYPELEGLAPRCLYWSFFKRFGQRDRMELLELFGKPWRVVTTTEESGAGPEDLADAEDAADQLGGSNTARMPRGVSLDVVQPGDTAGKVHAEVIAESDKQNSKLVLGQTGTTDAQNSGLGSSQPTVMANEQLLLLQGDAELLGEAVEDGLCDAIVALNRGVIELVNAPRFVFRAEAPTDRTKEAQRVKAALDTGVELAVDEAYEVMGFRKPTESDDRLSITSVPNGDGTSTTRAIITAAIKKADKEFGTEEPIETGTPVVGDGAPVGGATFTLAPTDLAAVVKVNEARQSAGLGPLTTPDGAPDPDGLMTLEQYRAKTALPKPAFGAPAAPANDQTPPEEPPPAPPEGPPAAPEGPPAPEAKDDAAPALPALMDVAAVARQYAERLLLEARGTGTGGCPEHDHEHGSVALARQPKLVQPETVHGTLEDVIDRGVKECARIMGAWAEQYCAAVRQQTTAAGINRAIARAHQQLGLNGYARALERRITHAAMTGALDSAWEGEAEEEIKPEAFAPPEADKAKASRVGLINLLAPETKNVFKNFVQKNYAEALKYFTSKQPIPKAQFQQLSAALKARSFTVAGLASEASLQVAHQELARAIVEGSDLREFSKRLGERFESAGMTPQNPSHVENVFRTNVLDTYNIGRRAQMTQPLVLKQRPYWLIRGVADARQRDTHKAVNGWVMRADDPFFAKGGPPWGYQCFLPGTRVKGDFIGASKAWYAGKAIELTTREGRRLAVTANHPVLTAQGLVAAQTIREGDQLVCDSSEPRVASLRQGAERDEDNAPAAVEQVFSALAQAGLDKLAAYGAEDFHGEAGSFVGQVEVVGSYRKLQTKEQACSLEQLLQLGFETTDAARAARRDTAAMLEGLRLAGPHVSGLSLVSTSAGIHAAPLDPLGIAPSSDWNAALAEYSLESGPTDARFAGQLLERGAGQVTLDEVVGVRQFDFEGHVYDLESRQGWLAANQVIASNCRCRLTAIREAKAKLLGIKSGAEARGLPDKGFEPSILVPPPSTLQIESGLRAEDDGTPG